MFSETIGNLKQRGLIADDDIAFFCMDKPSASAGVMFGAIGAAIAMSNVTIM